MKIIRIRRWFGLFPETQDFMAGRAGFHRVIEDEGHACAVLRMPIGRGDRGIVEVWLTPREIAAAQAGLAATPPA